MYDQKKFSLRRVENEKICSHPEKRYVAKYFVSDLGVEIRWIEGEEKLCHLREIGDLKKEIK